MRDVSGQRTWKGAEEEAALEILNICSTPVRHRFRVEKAVSMTEFQVFPAHQRKTMCGGVKFEVWAEK